jgi:hypothetical protein
MRNPAPEGYLSLREATARSGIHLGILHRDRQRGTLASDKINGVAFVRVDEFAAYTSEWFSRSHRVVAVPAITPEVPPLPMRCSLRALIEQIQGCRLEQA